MNALLQVVHGLDFGAYQFLNGFAGNWFLDHLAGFEERNNLLKGGLFLAMYASLWFRPDPRQEERRRTIFAILTGTLLALVVCRIIADIFPFRLRPMYDPSLPHHAYAVPPSLRMVDWSSFPSDTAAYFFALAVGLAHLLRRFSVPILLYTAGWICLPRMFLGEHYLSDILAGAAIGMVVVKASLASHWLRQRFASHVLRFMDLEPHVFYAAAFLAFLEMGVMFDDVLSPVRGLFHALHTGPSGDLFRAILTGLGILGAVLMGALLLLPVLSRRRKIRRMAFARQDCLGVEAAPGHGRTGHL